MNWRGVADLENTKVPASVSSDKKAVVEGYYHMAFIDTCSIIMRISAALGFLGALMAVVFIKNSHLKENRQFDRV